MNKKELKAWNSSRQALKDRLEPGWYPKTFKEASNKDINDIHWAMYQDHLAGKPLPEDLDELDWMNSND